LILAALQLVHLSVNLHTLYRQIARELKISRDTARHWRRRWLDMAGDEKSVPKRLQDAPRSGSPPTFTAEQLTHLFAIACEDPRESGGW
jgi:putative transposase